MFSNRRIAIATMHRKESVIAPLLEEAFKMSCVVPANLDTDLLGTFSGEIERKDDPISAARKKCNLAMDLLDCDIAIASEGSFGAHPSFFYLQSDDEIVLLVDRKNGIELFGRELSVSTNFNEKQVTTIEEALDFAKQVDFPSHGLIVRDNKNNSDNLEKGIKDPAVFEAIVRKRLQQFKSIWIETDMRALYNPTRMKVISSATENLIAKMNSKCPSCKHPGYWITDRISGLPCSLCGSETRSTLAHVYSCSKCGNSEQKQFPNNKTEEDPMYCDSCNP